MKVIAAIYSLLLGVITMWAWSTYFLYEGSATEHLLPGIALHIVTLPSSFLIEPMAEWTPWILNSETFMLTITTGLGGIQALVVWLMAINQFSSDRP